MNKHVSISVGASSCQYPRKCNGCNVHTTLGGHWKAKLPEKKNKSISKEHFTRPVWHATKKEVKTVAINKSCVWNFVLAA